MAEPEESIPSVLLPCNSCGRTFRPDALSKHAKYCEKSLIKKRKVFDSAKQRLQGTDLAEFLPVITQKKKVDKSPIRKTQSKWKEKHLEFVRAIRAAKGGPSSDSGAPAPPAKPVDHEKCLYCDRYFGPKAYDRHLEWCKEHSSRIRPKSPASIQAKERLEARTKYKAPLLNRTRRASISEKCSPKTCTRDPSPATDRLTRTRSSSLSSRTVTSMNRETMSNVSPKTNTANTVDSFKRNQPARNSRRSVSPMKKPTPDAAKNKAINNNVNQNNRTRGRQVTQQELKNEARRDTKTTPKSVKDDIFSASCNISPITPGQNQKQKPRTPSRNSGSKCNSNLQSKAEQCMLNTILISEDVMGMTVQQCCLKSDTENDELAEKYYKVGEESKYFKFKQSSARKSSRNEFAGKRQAFKPDLLISNDIVHFTGRDKEGPQPNQIDILSRECDNVIQQLNSSSNMLRSTENIENDPQYLATDRPDGDPILLVDRCSDDHDDNIVNDSKLINNIETPVESADDASIDDLKSYRFSENGNASECSGNCDVGVNSFFMEESASPELRLENVENNEVFLPNEFEDDVDLSAENEPKVSLEMLFSNPKIVCKENLCSNCQKSKSESDLLLFYRKDLTECCVKQRERMFEVKKSLFSMLSIHTLDAPRSRHSSCQGSVSEDEEHNSIEKKQYRRPNSAQSFTKFKSCSSIDEKSCRTSCSDKSSVISSIDKNERIFTSTKDEYNFQWGSIHEILSPDRKLSSESVDLIESLKQKFCNVNVSDEYSEIHVSETPGDGLVSSFCRDGSVVDNTDGCEKEPQYENESQYENALAIQSSNSKDQFVNDDEIESVENVTFTRTNEDSIENNKIDIGSSELNENSHNDFHSSMNIRKENISEYVDYEHVSSAINEEPLSRSFTKEDVHLNDKFQKESVGTIDDRLESDAQTFENVEYDRLSYIIESDRNLEDNRSLERSSVTRESSYSDVDNNDVNMSRGNMSMGFENKELKLDRTKEKLKTRNKVRKIDSIKSKKINSPNSGLNFNKTALDNVEIKNKRVEDKRTHTFPETDNRKSMLRKNLKSKIPSRKVNKPTVEVSLKSKIQTSTKNKNDVRVEKWKSRFPVIGRRSPTEVENAPIIELPSTGGAESDSCAVLYYNESVGRLWKMNNFDSKGCEITNPRNKTFALPPIKESSSVDSSKSLSVKQSESNMEQHQGFESIETTALRRKQLPMIRKETSNEMKVEAAMKFEKSMENYDPYKSAERQMKELLGLSDDDDALVHSLVPQPPSSSTAPVLNSFNSAFAKFAPIQSPSHNSNRSPDSDLDNDFERLEAESRVTPTLADRCDGIVDKNFNPMSLSTISLCSTISIESFDNSRNNLRKGISSSAKVPSCDRKAQLPLQRSVSVVETPRRGRDFLKSNLKMEHLLFGVTGSNHYNNNNFNDNCDVSDDSSSDNKTLRSSNDLLKNSNSSLADTSPAEQELLKSVSEFEKLFAMPSTLNPYSPLIPNSSLSNTLTPLDHIDKHRSQANKFITDSAYNSMNRKSPQQSSPVEMDTCWSGGSSECSSTRGGAVAAAVVGVGASQTANFCHECGSKFPVLAAKFCCNCGVRRLVI